MSSRRYPYRGREIRSLSAPASISRADLQGLPLIKLGEKASVARLPKNGGTTIVRKGRHRQTIEQPS
jgi:hypothetical protein